MLPVSAFGASAQAPTTGRTIDQFGLAITGSGTAGATNGGGKVTLSDGKPLEVTRVEGEVDPNGFVEVEAKVER